ncbi:MAG: hypothetical protein V1772_02700 [Chloroflexota bacterium]
MIQRARSAATHTLLLDAGNAWLNDQNPGKVTRGQSSVAAMNLMGYDAMTLGMLDLTALTPDEVTQRLGEARFAVLSANVTLSGSEQLVAEPYTLVELGGHRVAILGLTDQGSAHNLVSADPLAAARRWVPELRRQADIVIVLSHAGLAVDRRIAAGVPGIALIVSGGQETTREPLVVAPYGTLIVHAESPSIGNAGEAIGRGRLLFDGAGRLVRHEWERIWLDSTIPEDPAMNTWLREQWERLQD